MEDPLFYRSYKGWNKLYSDGYVYYYSWSTLGTKYSEKIYSCEKFRSGCCRAFVRITDGKICTVEGKHNHDRKVLSAEQRKWALLSNVFTYLSLKSAKCKIKNFKRGTGNTHSAMPGFIII